MEVEAVVEEEEEVVVAEEEEEVVEAAWREEARLSSNLIGTKAFLSLGARKMRSLL
jgi:hypothetical protein